MAWLRYLHNYMQQQERADLWHVLGGRFMRFAGEEQGRAEPTTKGEVLRRMDQVLRASCTYRKHPEGWERGKPEQGMICLLDTPPHGVWNYCSDGISENFFERVRLCVAQAGRALPDCPKDTDPEDFWLHRLYLNLLENNSDSLFCASKEGGMIVGVCVASATFCARLRRHALVHAEEDAKSSIIVSLEQTENLDEAGAAAFQQEVKAARLSLALGRPLTLTRGANQTELSLAQNRAKSPQSTPPGAWMSVAAAPYVHKLVACLAVEPADLWPQYGEAAPYVKQLAEIVWNQKVQWTMVGDALESHQKREQLIQIIWRDHPDVARELDLPTVGAVQEGYTDTSRGKPTESRKGQSVMQFAPECIGRNIDKLRTECGWSLDKLAEKTGIDKKTILSHVNRGAKPRPETLKVYAQAFAKELNRQITANNLKE